MGRSFVGGFLGALLALALVGVVMGVRGQPDSQRRVLIRQIDEWDRWRHDGPQGRRVLPLDHNAPYWLAWHPDDIWAPDDPDIIKAFLVSRPELTAYRAWLAQRRWEKLCNRSANTRCRDEAWYIDTAEMRDPEYLDRYLASRR